MIARVCVPSFVSPDAACKAPELLAFGPSLAQQSAGPAWDQTETKRLIVLAWCKENKFLTTIQKAICCLCESCFDLVCMKPGHANV